MELNTLNKFTTFKNGFESIARLKKNGETIDSFKLKRTKTLLVDSVTYQSNQGSFNNDHWMYKVPFAFHDALDIRLSKLQKNKHYYCAWTQGYLLNFSTGDFFKSTTDKPDLQVIAAKPMVWDSKKGVMYHGEVTYQSFKTTGIGDFTTVSQLDFLQLLMIGDDK